MMPALGTAASPQAEGLIQAAVLTGPVCWGGGGAPERSPLWAKSWGFAGAEVDTCPEVRLHQPVAGASPSSSPTCTQALTLSRSAPFHRDGLKAAPKSQKADSPSIDYAELLQHFERVQKKHLEVRHQRSGRGDHLDRRVVL